MATILELKSLTKGFPDTPVLNGIDLSVSEGEFIAILGFSGTGKTTLISLIAGLIEPDQGEVLIHGKPVSGPGHETSLVFQSYSLMPWLTVKGNVALAVDAVHTDMSKADREALVLAKIDLVGLSHAIDRKPAELSGGMRWR
jgi:nitrate/nitrite transport system ATP-binding protein